ncbi:MAG TPA: GcrA family cell cycle regulator [Micropepsaceae bacterium]|nr:GcrA family cell cycle regulator [Micropepsaceae bacterium]
MSEQSEALDDTPSDVNLIGPPMQEVPDDVKMKIRRRLPKQPITTIDLTSNTCRWPFGDPTEPDFHYCGQRPQPNTPYCGEHEAMSRPSGQHRNRA